MKYSERLGEISDAQLQKALDRFELGKLLSSSRITEGLFGQNLFLNSDKGEFVLRGVPHFDWQFPAEQFFAEQLHTKVPVPFPYLLESDTSIFGWSFAIMPKLPGRNIKLEELLTFDEADQRAIVQAQARTLAALHKLTWEFPGKFDLQLNAIKPLDVDYSEWIRANIEQRLTKAMGYNGNTTQADIDWANEFVNSKFANFELAQATIVMQDYKLENCVFTKTDSGWDITGVFDLMECYFCCGEADLARTYCRYLEAGAAHLAQHFVDSYIELTNTDASAAWNRLPAFILHDRAIVWDWRQRKEQGRVEFREWIDKYL